MKEGQSQPLGTEVWWLAFAVAASLGIYFVVPFPASLLAMAVTFMIVGYMIPMKRFEKHASVRAGRLDIVGCCIGCGTEHNDAACPNCGSKARKIGFSDHVEGGRF